MSTVSVLINAYNYGRYLPEAIDSALRQCRLPEEVIVVDDGSTDDTSHILTERYSNNDRIKVFRQRNGGQLAAFVLGLEHASGDLIFFLDADDKYELNHIETVTRCFSERKDVDFIFTAHRLFGEADGVVQYVPEDFDLGLSVIAALKGRIYLGSATSTLAFRRNVGLTLLPAMRQAAPRWPIRADDCLVYGASLMGARKYFLSAPTVLYRVHSENGLFGRKGSLVYNYQHGLRRDTFAELLCNQIGLGPSVRLPVVAEFLSIRKPTRAHYREYIGFNWRRRESLFRRLKGRIRLYLHYRRNCVRWDKFTLFEFRADRSATAR